MFDNAFNTFLFILVIVGLPCLFICCLKMCKAGSDEDDLREELLEDYIKNKNNNLSLLEQQTVDKLKDDFTNLDTKNKNYDEMFVGDFEDNFNAFGQRVILNDGKVLGFELR